MSNELKLKMTLPENFRQACEDMEADPQAVLQLFIDHLLFVTQVAAPGKGPESYTGMVLRRYLDTIPGEPKTNYKTRNINIKGTQKVLKMLRTNMSPLTRQTLYNHIIEKWHNELQRINH